ncbi:hypothetical protein [Lelliottia nimipressuralis]|uniref:DUF1482 family protein n=1 Tax=Lelliottia nimipressuralis TaxID=69220 RepID=A0ABY3P6M6_9ENTR|nr:hypothetical protein [Lelliottia nimipressuralis]RXJ10452.1 hypothetical protein ETG88_20025 [Lelliottia nimipressuralis]TYT34979.1 hypothetical protein FZO59_04925 [Lelliottia nimipressuralis]
MKTALKILMWIVGITGLLFCVSLTGESDRKDCEERLAKELNTTAVYINNHCMVKGYGRADGR